MSSKSNAKSSKSKNANVKSAAAPKQKPKTIKGAKRTAPLAKHVTVVLANVKEGRTPYAIMPRVRVRILGHAATAVLHAMGRRVQGGKFVYTLADAHAVARDKSLCEGGVVVQGRTTVQSGFGQARSYWAQQKSKTFASRHPSWDRMGKSAPEGATLTVAEWAKIDAAIKRASKSK